MHPVVLAAVLIASVRDGSSSNGQKTGFRRNVQPWRITVAACEIWPKRDILIPCVCRSAFLPKV